jgi:hypothetical protein
MSHLLVYATTESRLHADLVVVRLKRAGLPTAMISIIHPQSRRPNSALCWMCGTSQETLSSGEVVTVAGSLGSTLKNGRRNGISFCERIGRLGLTHEQSSSLENSLLEDRIVIAVEVHDEYELPAIYHTLRGLQVERVNISDVAHKGTSSISSHRYHPEFAPVAFSMPFGHAA